MGCDIHAVVQVKREDFSNNEKWFSVPDLGPLCNFGDMDELTSRSYQVFSVLGHEYRGDQDIEKAVKNYPRGYPDGFSVKDEEYRGDGWVRWMGDYGHSWISLRELMDYKGELYHYRDKIIPWLLTLGDPDDVRIVYGFDN